MLFRYKLPMGKGSEESRVIEGTLLYSYKWVYSKTDLNLPGVEKESASNMREFESMDKSNTIDRIRAVHIAEPVKGVVPEGRSSTLRRAVGGGNCPRRGSEQGTKATSPAL